MFDDKIYRSQRPLLILMNSDFRFKFKILDRQNNMLIKFRFHTNELFWIPLMYLILLRHWRITLGQRRKQLTIFKR